MAKKTLPAVPAWQQMAEDANDYAADAGAQALSDHARRNDPFAEIGRVQVGVEISSVIRASPDSFRVAWTERRYVDGQLADTGRWTASARTTTVVVVVGARLVVVVELVVVVIVMVVVVVAVAVRVAQPSEDRRAPDLVVRRDHCGSGHV